MESGAGSCREQGQAGRNTAGTQLWHGIQHLELQKQADESAYSTLNLKATEKVKR